MTGKVKNNDPVFIKTENPKTDIDIIVEKILPLLNGLNYVQVKYVINDIKYFFKGQPIRMEVEPMG